MTVKQAQILPISDVQENTTLSPLADEQAAICTAHPASFLIACAVLARLRDSVTELRDLICRVKPELEVVFDRVLVNMAENGLVKVFGDRIVILKPGSYSDFGKNLNFGFLPKIASILCERILTNARAGSLAKAEHIRWYFLSNHPEVEKRLLDIHLRYRAEMEKLVQWSEDHPECIGEKVRLTMVMSGNLISEDV